MNTSPERPPADCRVLLIGAGGVGAPCAIALAEAGLGHLVIADDDQVESENLHRQLLFFDGDVGRSKPATAKRALAEKYRRLDVASVETRALPTTALSLVRGMHAVVDATDNFPSRFLIADACRLGAVPVIHAAAVRWTGTVTSVGARGVPCYRCLFEEPPETAPDCATAGIIGPVCGVIGGIAAEMALDAASGRGRLAGKIATFDGRTDALRLVALARRRSCPLCGDDPSIFDLAPSRYTGAAVC
jgi:adenylyltransferase/sulfurtransferase